MLASVSNGRARGPYVMLASMLASASDERMRGPHVMLASVSASNRSMSSGSHSRWRALYSNAGFQSKDEGTPRNAGFGFRSKNAGALRNAGFGFRSKDAGALRNAYKPPHEMFDVEGK